MKTGIMTKQFTMAFGVGSAAVMVMLLSAGSVQATDQSWTSGTTTLTIPSGVDTDNDIVDNATLIVTNGGSLLASQLTVSTGNVSTLTLTGSGAITVKQLWVTNNTTAATNSIFNFNGGTLITSNAVGSVAARIVCPLPFSINGNWTMNGGTNTIAPVVGVTAGTVGIGSNVTVNAGALYNNGGLALVTGANSTLIINGGVMTNIKVNSTTIFNVTGGNSSMTVTNNGKLLTSGASNRSAIIGQISVNNRVFIGSGGLWNFGGIGLLLGVSSTSAGNNTLTVDADGMVTNMGGCSVGSSTSGTSAGNQVVITNGGCVFGNSGVTVGSTSGTGPATSNRVTVVGSTSLLNIGGDINVGFSTGTGKSSYNSLLITNGASVVSKGACTIGNGANANSNYVIVAGASSGTNAMWNLSGSNLTIGGNAAATGNWAVVSTGGMITNGAIVLGGVNSALYFNGGTLAAGANCNLISTNSTAINVSGYVQNAGAVIDSGAYSVTNMVPLVQDPASQGGGLTKIGSGRLVLAGTSRYTGATAVSNGTLQLAADGVITNSAVISVASGAVYDVSSVSGYEVVAGQTLAGKGVVTGSVTVVAGGILAAGGTDATGTLSFSNTLTLAGSAVIDWNYDDTTNDVIKVATLGTLPSVATVTVSRVTGSTRAQPLPAVLCTFAQGGPGVDTDLSGWVVTGGSAGTRVVVRGNQIQFRAFTGTLLQLY